MGHFDLTCEAWNRNKKNIVVENFEFIIFFC